MAVTATPCGDKLIIKIVDGTTAEGKPKLKTMTLSNVKPAATNDNIFAVAEAISKVQTKTVNSVIRDTQNTLLQS